LLPIKVPNVDYLALESDENIIPYSNLLYTLCLLDFLRLEQSLSGVEYISLFK